MEEGAMEMIFSKVFTIPIYQVGLLLLLSSLAFFLGRLKLTILINYLFVFYWAYWLNSETLLGPGVPPINAFTLGCFGFSVLIFVLALIGFIHRPA